MQRMVTIMPTTTRRITFNVDADLLAAAREVLATGSTTETLNAALAEVVRVHRVERLLEQDFSTLTPEVLEELRRGRTGRW
jgi:hypothetical protein